MEKILKNQEKIQVTEDAMDDSETLSPSIYTATYPEDQLFNGNETKSTLLSYSSKNNFLAVKRDIGAKLVIGAQTYQFSLKNSNKLIPTHF